MRAISMRITLTQLLKLPSFANCLKKLKKKFKPMGSHKRHPYLNLQNYVNGNLCFWRRKPEPGSLVGYNVAAYEQALAEQLKNEKKISSLQSNIGNKN
jgi:hypothetical protein